MQVDAIEQWSGYARLVIGAAACVRPAPAGEPWLIGFAAAARVHRRDQHETRWIGDAVIGARDRHLAAFERLAQRIERLRLEFREFVKEQHAVMGERHFAGARTQATADQGRHAGGVMRRAKRSPIGQCATFDLAGDRRDHPNFQELGGSERR